MASTRREFVSLASQAAVALPLLSVAACSRDEPAAAPTDARWQSLIEYLEKEIPSLLKRAPATPAAAIALVADAKLLWSRGFGVTDRMTNPTVAADTSSSSDRSARLCSPTRS